MGLRILGLAIIALSGLFDLALIKSRALAFVTWLLGLLALAVWIGYPLTPIRICFATMAFLSGLALIIFVLRKWSHRS